MFFLHRRDFRFPLVTTETDFWESAILDSQLSKYPVSRLKSGIIPVLSPACTVGTMVQGWLGKVREVVESRLHAPCCFSARAGTVLD